MLIMNKNINAKEKAKSKIDINSRCFVSSFINILPSQGKAHTPILLYIIHRSTNAADFRKYN